MNLVSFHGVIAGVSIAMTMLVIWAAWGEHREGAPGEESVAKASGVKMSGVKMSAVKVGDD